MSFRPRFMQLQASPNESVHSTGALGRDCREEDELEDMVDAEQRMEECKGHSFQ